MYLQHFKLDQLPFSITPDPDYVYLSEKHQESLAHLIYGVTRGGGSGFVQLTGEVGTGKTTICRLFLQQLPENIKPALILNPLITPLELMESLFKEMGISRRGMTGQLNRMVEQLNNYLLKSWAEGITTVIIIDEAQNLPRDTLEHLRLLTNLETDQQKLLQIILIGQPELQILMQRQDLRQLAQRITSRFHLHPLSQAETSEYIVHRLQKAGAQQTIINAKVRKKIHQITRGTPRTINVLCDRALLAAYADNSYTVGNKHIQIAQRELLNKTKATNHSILAAALAAVVTICLSLLYWHSNRQPPETLETQIKQTAATALLPPEKVTAAVKTTQSQTAVPPLILPSAEQAWRILFSLWDIPSTIQWKENTCPSAEITGLACLRRQGNLNQIKMLNAPVLLELNNQQLIPLVKYDRNNHWYWNDNTTDKISRQWLQNNWHGNYYVLWPIEANLVTQSTAQTVNQWAIQLIAQLEQTKRFNRAQLKPWILKFQQDNGLIADGIIGKETQMALSLKAYQGPKLNK